jgi:phosphatidylserine/phosphatidylglycerophosphate/cardiolipin synthase-like enzyme
MKNRGVKATLFLDIEGTAETAAGADAFATAFIDRFLRKVWTFGEPKPDVYYDPRTAVPGPPWASLHAKCIAVDDERALITSANFTDRGQTRNIEAGVLVEGAAFAGELAGQWRQLVSEGLVRKYEG